MISSSGDSSCCSNSRCACFSAISRAYWAAFSCPFVQFALQGIPLAAGVRFFLRPGCRAVLRCLVGGLQGLLGFFQIIAVRRHRFGKPGIFRLFLRKFCLKAPQLLFHILPAEGRYFVSFLYSLPLRDKTASTSSPSGR